MAIEESDKTRFHSSVIPLPPFSARMQLLRDKIRQAQSQISILSSTGTSTFNARLNPRKDTHEQTIRMRITCAVVVSVSMPMMSLLATECSRNVHRWRFWINNLYFFIFVMLCGVVWCGVAQQRIAMTRWRPQPSGCSVYCRPRLDSWMPTISTICPERLFFPADFIVLVCVVRCLCVKKAINTVLLYSVWCVWCVGSSRSNHWSSIGQTMGNVGIARIALKKGFHFCWHNCWLL